LIDVDCTNFIETRNASVPGHLYTTFSNVVIHAQ